MLSIVLFVEKMGPLRGDGNLTHILSCVIFITVEKMGPLRGDGNHFRQIYVSLVRRRVEKMGPLRGDGNFYKHYIIIL